MIFKIPSAGLTGDSSTMQSSAGADRLKNNSQTQFISDETKPTWLFWIQTCFEEKENKLQKQQSETYLPIRCLYSKRLDTCLWRGVSHTFLVRSLWRSVNNLFRNYCWSWHGMEKNKHILCFVCSSYLLIPLSVCASVLPQQTQTDSVEAWPSLKGRQCLGWTGFSSPSSPL